MQSRNKKVLFVCLLFCLCFHKGIAQPIQLPSLLNESDLQNDAQKNAILNPGEDPQAKIHSLIFIKTFVSKKHCYVGEPILVTYQLYTAVSCHSRVTKQVAFSGCSVIEMTDDEPEQIEKEDGKIYRVQLIRKVQLIPLQAGDLMIPPATVNNDVGFSTADNPYSQKSYSADISSPAYTIQVAALPEQQPEDFSGITGKFTIEAKADSTNIAAGENNRLQVTIAGIGNIEAVTEPKINWPKHTEHFDPLDSQHINRLNFPESGDKTFIFPFINTQKGNVIIPEISFTYFNTDLKKFETISTAAIPLQITASIKKAPVVITSDNDESNEKYLWFVPGIAVVVIAVWLLINKNQKKPVVITPVVQKEEQQTKPITEEKIVRPDYELLLTALNVTEDNKTFFINAKTLLVSTLQYYLSPKQEDENILINILDRKDKVLAKEAEEMMSICNQGLYTPVEDEAIRSRVIECLSHIIQQLENNQSVYL